jgi:hypothetical protein
LKSALLKVEVAAINGKPKTFIRIGNANHILDEGSNVDFGYVE